MMSGMNRQTVETMPYESKLSTFKVNELQSLLHAFKVQKIGKKNELYTRCIELLRTPNMTRSVIDKIREIENRVNQRVNPYPLPTMNNYQNTQQINAATTNELLSRYRQNMNSYNAYGGNMMQNLNQLGGMGMHQNVQGMMSITPRPARNLTPMTLPFYDAIHTLLEPQELPASVNNGSKMGAAVHCQFTLSPEHHMKLSVKENEFPRTEVQLRFFNVTGDILNIEQPDDFPLNCSVKINEAPVTLPNVIPTNKPNVEPKRPSRPVNITQNVISQPRDKTHRMKVDWTADKRQWAVAIYLVIRVNSDILRNRIVKSPSFELPYETTEATIRKRLGGGDDDDVAMDSLKISLLCPLGKTRMNIAARSRDCTHIQCFDLDLYLQLNEKRPTWKCGVCSGNAPYHKLIIDKYFMKMLHDLGSAVTDVELLKDGNYRVIKEEDICDISDDDDAPSAPAAAPASAGGSRSSSTAGAPPSSSAAPAAPAAAAKKAEAEDIITISDDDEEDQDLRNAIRASMPGATEPPRRTPVKVHASPSSDDSIIILDDTPPRPVDPRLPENRPADRPILTDPRLAPSSSTAATSTSTASWRSLSSSSAAGGGVTSSSGTTAGGGGAYGGQMRANNLHDALNQAGLRSGLQLGGSPLSAAAVGQQQNIYNWQQPQSAPPMMGQWSYNQQMTSGYGGYFNAMQYNQSVQAHQNAAQAAYAQAQQWSPPNAGPVYTPNANGTGGVIRRQEEPR
ncbi:hypothetical protein PENTCL1PPCAC_22207 [Pristionchus entomophagus]|uniref:Gei-17 n=1 Tax=Pristionchus entomophagus TaxID=358040 RepID=A0AAV5U086_9BILA|nr:hypothetical protein PENTCL1PPCAC_22207 [Pristionchus entomophagus]